MSIKNYFELNSTYRDRSIYPNPAAFVANPALTNSNNIPTTSSMPCYNFKSFDNLTGTYGFGNDYGPGNPSIPHLEDAVPPPPALGPSSRDGYYNGMSLEDGANSSSIIINYNGAIRSCELASRLSDNWASGNTYTIKNPSNGDGTSNPGPFTVILHGAPAQNDYFHGYFLEDVSLNPTVYFDRRHRFKKIIRYNGTTRAAYLGNYESGCSEGFPKDFGTNGYRKQDAFRIRQTLPSVMGFGTAFLKAGDPNVIAFNGAPAGTGTSQGNSGTGPLPGRNSAAYIVSDFIKVTPNVGIGFTSGDFVLTNVTQGTGGTGLDILVTINVDAGGVTTISNPRVVSPGGGYSLSTISGDIINNPATWTSTPIVSPPIPSATIEFAITATGQSVDITNARTGNILGSLATASGQINTTRTGMIEGGPIGQILYVPSKGPENNYTDSNINYYGQLPLKLSDEENQIFCDSASTSTGTSLIIGYLSCPLNVTELKNDLVQITYKPGEEPIWIIVENENLQGFYKTGFATPVSGGFVGDDESVCWEILPKYEKPFPAPFNISLPNSNVNEQEYEIELLKLIVPNVSLKTGIGGRVSFYPYLYVVLQSNADSINNIRPGKTTLASNNPNAANATFLIPINNAPSPIISKFIHVSGEGAVQSIMFNPVSPIAFKIYLTDGETFKAITNDNAPPELPNPYLQISALFEYRIANNSNVLPNQNRTFEEYQPSRKWGFQR